MVSFLASRSRRSISDLLAERGTGVVALCDIGGCGRGDSPPSVKYYVIYGG